MSTKKEMAKHFLTLCAHGDSREAFKLYVAKEFKHHNAYFASDAETLMIAMEDAHKANPNKVFEIQRALEDGDLVAVHSKVKQARNDADFAVMHIFRFNTDKIVEFWDFGQLVPEDMPNKNGMF
ncbi:MAG TPA: nuclear transport factor 2 family protein [Bacteroidia bacterium]|jgi:predicted SnoaL-like aldol condensation-catalyzing enzyme|nr:nuclear transport factor 2 family protein [Bacteroidia bacterium]